MPSLDSIVNSLCRAQRAYQTPVDKIGRMALALIDLTRHVDGDDLVQVQLRNVRKLASKLAHQLDAVRYHTD